MRIDGKLERVAGERRLSQADLEIDENGCFIVLKSTKPVVVKREQATLGSAMSYLEKLMERHGLSIKWSTSYDEARNTLLHLPETTLVYDKDGNYLESRPPMKKGHKDGNSH